MSQLKAVENSNKFPHRFELYWATLEALKALGGQGSNDEIVAKVIELKNYSKEIVEVPQKGIKMTKLEYKLAWIRTNFKTFGAIDNLDRGVWALKDKGRDLEEKDMKSVCDYVRNLSAAKRKNIRKASYSDPMHVVVKFTYNHSDSKKNDIVTLDEHLKIFKDKGEVFFGTWSNLHPNKVDKLNNQVAKGDVSYVYLYGFKTPEEVSVDHAVWYRAKIKEVSSKVPEDKNLIPEYYRDLECGSYFLLESLEKFDFPEGETPIISSRSTFQYAILKEAGDLSPRNLFRYNNIDATVYDKEEELEEKIISLEEMTSLEKGDLDVEEKEDGKPRENVLLQDSNLVSDLLDAKDKIIELKDEVLNLEAYKKKFDQILDTESLFSSETLLESWIEGNIHKILPHLQIIDRQPSAKWPDGKFGRMDLLAKNLETHELVIIEVKTRKRNIKSGYDQFLRYKSWAKHHKEVLSKKYEGLKETDNPEFVIVTDFVTDEMVSICKDNQIKIIKIFGGLGFDKVA